MRFQCPNCKEIVSVDNSEMGARVQCGKCQQIVTVPASRTSPGAVIADFIIQKEIGRGGMGVVYLSHQISLDRSAALKVLSEAYANNTEFVVGFIKEARAAAKLNHPHIVQAYAVGEDEGIYYFAMENVNGETMKAILERNHVIPVDQAVQIIQQVAEALDYAWKEERLIHRDIKPDNIMLTNTGKAKLADLGLARRAGEKDDLDNNEEVMGTPQYISPEHLIGEEMDIRSDIYSLGATFYHFVTGQFPFTGSSVTEIARKHLTDPLIPPNQVRPSIPQAVSDVIVKMMEKDPNKRYQDAEELVEVLRDIRKNKLTAPKSGSLHLNVTGSRPVPRLNLKTSASTPVPRLNLKTSASSPVPRLNLNGAGGAPAAGNGGAKSMPSISLPQTGAPGGTKPPVPPAPKQEVEKPVEESGKETSLEDTLTRELDSMQASRETKARVKVILLILGILILLGLVGVGVYFLFFGPGAKWISSMTAKVGASGKKAAEALAVAQEPENTALTMKAAEILKYAGEKPDDSARIVALCEEFFKNFKTPKYEIEKTRLKEIQALYQKADEQLLSSRRAAAREAELKKQEEERLAKERQEQERREQAARAAQRRKEEEARKRQKQKEAAELNALRNRIRSGMTRVRVELVDKISDGKFAEAKKILQGVIDSAKSASGKPAQYRNAANGYAGWGRKMLGMVNRAEKMAGTLKNAGSELNRPQVVYKRDFGYVTAIRDGVLTVDQGGGKSFEVEFEDLPHSEQMSLVSRIGKRAKRTQDAFCYLLFNGEFGPAEEFAENNDLKNEWRQIGTDYIRTKYRSGNAERKADLQRKYGKLSYFKQAAGIR